MPATARIASRKIVREQDENGGKKLAKGNAAMLYPEYDQLICDGVRGYDSPTILYRYFDAEGRLLYVGIAKDVESRDQQHLVSARWRHEAVAMRMEMYPQRSVAETAEKYAIENEDPIHNVKRMPPSPPGCAYHWYLYKMGGLRGELVRWAAPQMELRAYPKLCNAPEWWNEDRVFVLPYDGKPAYIWPIRITKENFAETWPQVCEAFGWKVA